MEISIEALSSKILLHKPKKNFVDCWGSPNVTVSCGCQEGRVFSFAMIPMNVCGAQRAVDYVDSGFWSRVAAKEASKYADVRIVASDEKNGDRAIPKRASWQCRSDARYLHYTANETIGGVEFLKRSREHDSPGQRYDVQSSGTSP